MISINKSSRDQALDLMRGIAIIMMILFHFIYRSEEHTSELQSRTNLVCRLLLEKKKKTQPDL